jgi:ferric-dicitrate binding protein FerR (iron transport regulator)
MDSPTIDINQLIAAYLSGNCGSSGKSTLEQWISLSEKNKEVFDDSVKIWENCQTPLLKSEIEHDRLRTEVQIFAHLNHQ